MVERTAAGAHAQASPLAGSASRWIAACTTTAGLAAFACVAAGLAIGTGPEEQWRLAARWTARLAFLLFLPVYLASAWHRLAPSGASRLVLRRRRALGLGFAAAHTVHLVALSVFFAVIGERPDPLTLVAGGLAFAVLFGMAATSNDAAVRRLGRRWHQLHGVGIHYLWFVFTFTYAGRLAQDPAAFAPLVALAFAALGLRLAAALARRRAGARTAP